MRFAPRNRFLRGSAAGPPCRDAGHGPPSSGLSAAAVCFPNLYVWFVFLSSLDILFTSIVLTLGGIEANPLVDWVLVRWGLVGIVAYKFTIVMFVVSMCEIVGRRRARAGRRLAEWTVAIAAIPVYLAVLQLLLSVRTYAG